MSIRNNYNKNFKEEAVKLALETSVPQAARGLGMSEHTLRNWVRLAKEHSENAFIGSGNKYSERHKNPKVLELEKEIRELKRANEILKEAMSFFVKSQKN